MVSLDNLLLISIRDGKDDRTTELREGITHYYLNLWHCSNPTEPTIIPVPYRGGYIGGFNDITTLDDYILVADGKGILAYDIQSGSKDYVEMEGVDEISQILCKTPKYLISCWDNVVQIRSLGDIIGNLKNVKFKGGAINVPSYETRHEGENENILSLVRIKNGLKEIVLLNNTGEKTILIDPNTGRAQSVEVSSEQHFSHTFQRQEQYHPIKIGDKEYTIFTESTSDDIHPNRIYSLDIREPPTIDELEPLVLENRQILSMVPTLYNQLTLLTDHNGRNYIETLEPNRRKILNSRPLNRRYELGDRLQQVDNDLLIVRHLKNEIVDVATEDSIRLTGAENDVPIPEISSTWEIPQYLYVTKSPTGVR